MLKIAPAHIGRVNKLVRRLCCCYDRGNCILLDDGEPHRCVQMLSFSGIYCNYFKRAVLPADKQLCHEIKAYNKNKTKEEKPMRITRTPHHTQRVNRFVQELFTACNENGADFILNDEEAYQCAKIIAVYNGLYCQNKDSVTDRDLLEEIKRIKN